MRVQLVKKSSNAKTGPIPVTTSSRETCPDSCPYSGSNGCYAQAGYYTRLNWDKVTNGERGMEWTDFVDAIDSLPDGTLFRHNVAGDLPGEDNVLDEAKVFELAAAASHARGFTYTHYPVDLPANAKLIRMANDMGFTINVSCDGVRDAVSKAKKHPGLPLAAVVPSDHGPETRSIDGVKFVTCPATYKDNVSCATCKLCSVRDRGFVVAFPAHGTGSKKVDVIVSDKV